MVEDLCALDKVVGDLGSRCRVRVTTSTSTSRGEGLGRVGVFPFCGSFQNLIFLVGRLEQLEHLETSEEVSPSHLTDELVTPGPGDENDLSLAHAQDLDTFGVLNRHAAVGDGGITPDRHMNRSRRIGSLNYRFG